VQQVPSKRSNSFLPAISDTGDTSQIQKKFYHKKSTSLASVNSSTIKELILKTNARNAKFDRIYANSPTVFINNGGVEKFGNGPISVRNGSKYRANLLDAD